MLRTRAPQGARDDRQGRLSWSRRTRTLCHSTVSPTASSLPAPGSRLPPAIGCLGSQRPRVNSARWSPEGCFWLCGVARLPNDASGSAGLTKIGGLPVQATLRAYSGRTGLSPQAAFRCCSLRNIGKHIGAGKILDYAERFGFYATPDLELPADAQSPSGLYKKHKVYKPKHPEYQVDPGRLAFGQERLLVTPVQMAMVAATVANGGVLMQPHLIDSILAPNGSVVRRVRPDKVRRVISTETAQQLTQMMESVVTGGTATNVQIPGVRLAGKTGTAETGVKNKYDTWFIAFAPAEAPRIAVAVALENQTGFGATTAGPIAKAIVEAILRQKANT